MNNGTTTTTRLVITNILHVSIMLRSNCMSKHSGHIKNFRPWNHTPRVRTWWTL